MVILFIVLAGSFVLVHSLDRMTRPALKEQLAHGSNAICAMQYLGSFTGPT